MITKQTTYKNKNGETVTIEQADGETIHLMTSFGESKIFTALTFDEVEAVTQMHGFEKHE